jgi:hypothetical protein
MADIKNKPGLVYKDNIKAIKQKTLKTQNKNDEPSIFIKTSTPTQNILINLQ